MVRQVNLYEAKTNLSQLVEDAAKGEEIVIAKNGKPMARLVSQLEPEASPRERQLDQWAKSGDKDRRSGQEWWRNWKAMDRELDEAFQKSIRENWGRYEKQWADTSSTPTSSFGLRDNPRDFAGQRSRKSKRRKTRST
jgi:prevent-host-death family protein